MENQKNRMVPEQKAQKAGSKQSGSALHDKIEILYYTDPLCCWSWAFEPQWRRLKEEFKDKIDWHYCMGGLLPDWKNFNDSLNSVTRPVQMGPVWMHASQVAGIPINYNIWMTDPPASSYPACIAVKCAEFQSSSAGDFYLSLLRQACMLDGQNIARKEVLMQIASEMAKDYPGLLNINVFKEDFNSTRGMEAFRKDLYEVIYHRIHRFPTLIIKKHHQPAVLLTGYIPYEVLLNTITALQKI